MSIFSRTLIHMPLLLTKQMNQSRKPSKKQYSRPSQGQIKQTIIKLQKQPPTAPRTMTTMIRGEQSACVRACVCVCVCACVRVCVSVCARTCVCVCVRVRALIMMRCSHCLDAGVFCSFVFPSGFQAREPNWIQLSTFLLVCTNHVLLALHTCFMSSSPLFNCISLSKTSAQGQRDIERLKQKQRQRQRGVGRGE